MSDTLNVSVSLNPSHVTVIKIGVTIMGECYLLSKQVSDLAEMEKTDQKKAI